jgi:hypothetical protein
MRMELLQKFYLKDHEGMCKKGNKFNVIFHVWLVYAANRFSVR